MKFRICLIAAAVMALGCTQVALAAQSSESSQDGLTWFGAIKAGNEAGTIPPYTGGLKVTDEGYSQDPYPYADEEPRLVITADNMDKYLDKLAPGTEALLKRYPGYHLSVYPTHRSSSYPGDVKKHTIDNASGTACRITDSGLGLTQACRRGLPFPHPKTGKQLLWNHILAYQGVGHKNLSVGFYWADGTVVKTLEAWQHYSVPYYAEDPANPKIYLATKGTITGPPRQQGLLQLQWFYLDPADNSGKLKRVWIYTPGFRRVRRAPNASHDTPFAATGGNMVYSEQYLYSGLMDRFNYKLVSHKEMFIPYNSFKLSFECSPDKVMTEHHVNPECLRWELHRVWVVEATLKPNMHSIYSKRMYYFDEDTYLGGLYAAWDHAGNLDRIGLMTTVPFPKHHATTATTDVFYNMKTDTYFYINYSAETSYAGYEDEMRSKIFPPSVVNPRNMRGSGVF